MAERKVRLATTAVTIIAVTGLPTGGLSGVGPSPLALLPEQVGVTRLHAAGRRTLGGIVIRTRRRWAKLRLALPAIRSAPPSRSDTPALPTVGRARDSPSRMPLG